MQRNINIAMGNDNVERGRYSCLFRDEFGGTGEYRCESDAIARAIVECETVAARYSLTPIGEGERIAPLFISERHDGGNETVAYRF